MKHFIAILIMILICSCNEKPGQTVAKTKKNFSWPPVLGKEYPNLQLYNHRGEFVRLNKFKGKIIVVEPIGMNCPACNAFAGANDKSIGKFSGISPQANLPSFKEALKTYGGIDFSKEDIIYIHLLLYDLKMQAPTQQDAKNWAKHFAIHSKNEMVLVGTKEMQGRASYRMIPGFYLIDENFMVVSDSTGHHPKHNLYTELIPKLKKLLQRQKQSQQAFYEIYPRNTDAPKGTKYPCAFAPLPSHLKGIPPPHRIFVTKFFAHVVEAIHTRLKMHQVFYDTKMNRRAELKTYHTELQKVIAALQKLEAPHEKLQKLPGEIVKALLLQQKAYTTLVETGKFAQQDARAGSRILLNSWQQVSRYYSKMNPEVKNAAYHHLCALDVY
ncbi:hypothetical protein [Candidatus Uabimicrobium amorphum]|uniref:Thioredoxin domain-containing protein n=1 Tax=Uabimicrobium amorphum TaxID=2596890 RepID=A0A5S9IRB3_UABAM|nr:hypothetical protein [Candidatus Uabimicrobium amorphum]BBM86474.1 hypothetical protein UABAM_04860 [Candidatus Uabimicrobium amorphum]